MTLADLVKTFDETIADATGWRLLPIAWLIERNAEEIRDAGFAVEWPESPAGRFVRLGGSGDPEVIHVAILKLSRRLDSMGGADTAQRDAMIDIANREREVLTAVAAGFCEYGAEYGGVSRRIVNGVLFSDISFRFHTYP